MQLAQRCHYLCTRVLIILTALGSLCAENAWAGSPPPPPAEYSTACGGHPCLVSTSNLLQQVLRSGMPTPVSQVEDAAGTRRREHSPGGERFALSTQGETGQAAGAGDRQAWNGWISSAQANVGTSFNPLKSDGSVNSAMVGIDYTFLNKAILGLALADTRARIDTKFNGGSFSADGLTLAPYLLYPLNANWAVNAGMGFGRSNLKSFDNTNGVPVSGRNDSDTTLANLGIEYNRTMGNWGFTGRTGVSSYRDKQTSQNLSNGTVIPGSTTTASQVRLGGEITYNAGAWMPYGGLAYVYDSHLPTQNAVSGVTPSNDRSAVQILLGVQYRSRGALYGGLQLMTEQGRSDMKNDAAMLNLGMYF